MTASVDPNIFDQRGLADLKRLTKANDPQAIKAAARQFEAMFLSMVLKSMRDATPKDGIMDSDQTRMYESLLDQQLAQVMATKGNGTGLAAMIEKQLTRTGTFDPVLPTTAPSLNPETPAIPVNQGQPGNAWPAIPSDVPVVNDNGGGNGSASNEMPSNARDFVARVWPHAVEASRTTGIPAQFLVAHAALETGWGRSEPRYSDGRPSHNLFGIKAGKSWSGQSINSQTTEYVDGVPQRQVERFRAYESYADAFRDYGNLLASNPRYAKVVGSTNGSVFARGLQQAGYATDPQYANKLERIIGSLGLRQAMTG